jgi:hypothetical protein
LNGIWKDFKTMRALFIEKNRANEALSRLGKITASPFTAAGSAACFNNVLHHLLCLVLDRHEENQMPWLVVKLESAIKSWAAFVV